MERPSAAAGSSVRLALKVSLPESLHTQSNKPLDPTLIPTVLTIDAPAGVTVDEIVYPPAIDLKQEGLEQPLAVFEHEFLMGAKVTLGPGMAEGDLVLPGRLRYQACNDMMCFPPATMERGVDDPRRAEGARRECAAERVVRFDRLGNAARNPSARQPRSQARRREPRRRPPPTTWTW